MRIPSNALFLLAAAGAAACGDDLVGPAGEDAPVRTLLVHRQDTGDNLLVDTDGTMAGTFSAASRGMLPIGAHGSEGAVVLLNGTAIVLTTVGVPDRMDTVIHPSPLSQSLASFSHDGTAFALVSYSPERSVLLYDRVNHTLDTLSLAGSDPVLPPVFSPDGERLALISVNELSILVTIIYRFDPSRSYTERLSVSRFLNRPVFGWPRWVGNGIRMAFRRVADPGPDTLLVGTVFPDSPGDRLQENYRAVMAPVSDERPELDFGSASTYALTLDGEALALAAVPGTGLSPHAVYVVTPGVSRVQLVLDGGGEYPVFPLFIRE